MLIVVLIVDNCFNGTAISQGVENLGDVISKMLSRERRKRRRRRRLPL